MKHLKADKENHVYSARIQSLLNNFNINHYSTHSDKHPTSIEQL